jgi:hypothetical protein
MYEPANVGSISCAHDLIMGVKPFCMNVLDSEGMPNRCDWVEDIEEED